MLYLANGDRERMTYLNGASAQPEIGMSFRVDICVNTTLVKELHGGNVVILRRSKSSTHSLRPANLSDWAQQERPLLPVDS